MGHIECVIMSPCIMSLILSVLSLLNSRFQEAILAWPQKPALTPRLVRLYRTRQRDASPWHRWHDVCHPSAVSLPFSGVALCMGPSLYFLPSLLLGMWWGAVIYKKWLGGNSSNMICVGAHKNSPSVTLKEWNGRAVLIRLLLSHCRDHKCVQNQAVGWGFSVNFYQC